LLPQAVREFFRTHAHGAPVAAFPFFQFHAHFVLGFYIVTPLGGRCSSLAHR
jgi:hypothetical protein